MASVNAPAKKRVDASGTLGLIGAGVGALAAGAAAIPTGGMSLAAIPAIAGAAAAGAGTGQFVGGLAGTAFNKEGGRIPGPSAIERRAQARTQGSFDSTDSSDQLRAALEASKQVPAEVQSLVQEPLKQAYVKALSKRYDSTGV